ncbi:MAG: hypothetical protein HYU51_01150 [Candidatus Rokubacteria bacterium]|nr:hypothetical protein [Candidatus Rokubacteria bacterium]
MKRLLSVFVAFAFVTGMVSVAAAQTGTATEKKPAEKTEKAGDKAEKKADKKPAAKNARGTVKSAGADSLVVAGKAKGKDTEWTFAVDPKTKIKKGGKDATAADLQAGDSVQVRYSEQDGKMVAQSISASTPRAAKRGGVKNPCAAAARSEKKEEKK